MKSHPSYEMVGVVGRGRLATVYRVREIALNREVAVKELNDEARRDPQLLERFWDEARFLAGVEHDNVVQIYGLDQERGWIIMELAASGLDACIARAPLPAGVVRGVLRQALDGLDCLHNRGRVHGAVKPGNLLVTREGLVKLSDTTGVAGGPPTDLPAKYVAPEQTDPSFGPAGVAADLYCLGFTALELLAGPRFVGLFPDLDTRGDAEIGWWRLHGSHDAMPAAATAVPGLPADIARVIDRLLQKDVSARYASAADALKDLTDVPSPPVPLGPTVATVSPGQVSPLPPTPSPASPATFRGSPVAVDTGGPDQPAGGMLEPTIFPVNPPPTGRGAPFPAAPAVVPPPPPARAEETVRDTPQYPRWSRRWINQKLENPRVLYPVCGTIAFITLLLLADLFLNRSGGPKQPPPSLRAVSVTSKPDGALVFFDNDKEPQKQKTDGTFEIEPGTHTVVVKKDDYDPQYQVVEVPADGSSVPSVSFELKPSRVVPPTTGPPPVTTKPPATTKPVEPMPTTGKLVVRSSPGKATIFINGREKPEQTPAEFDLPPGSYTVRLKRANHKDWEEPVEVKAGGRVVREPVLERLRDPSSFALLVGVRSAADGLPVFRHAPADIAELGRTLLAAGYPEGNVTVLAQLPGAPAGTVPTAERVRQAVAALVKDRIPGDTLLLALAGPAVVAPGSATSYFCPAGTDLGQPATLVSLDEVFQKLAACPAETKVVLIDGNRVGASAAARPLAAKPEDLAVGGVTVLTATANGAPGHVLAGSGERHGVFWKYVLGGLRGDAEGADHKVTLGKLARRVIEGTRSYVAETYKAEQTPKLVPATAKDSAAVVAAPDPALQCLQQGDALLAKAGQEKDAALSKKEYEQAAEKFGQAISLRRDLVEAYLRRAVAYYSLDNFDGMIEDCTEVARLDPSSAEAYDYRGDAHTEKAGKNLDDMNLGEMNLALQDYTKSIELDPDCASVYNSRSAARGSLSRVYDKKKQFEKARSEDEQAVADSTRAIDLAPKPRSVYFENRARAYKLLEKNDRAADDYTAALQTGEQLGKRSLFRLYYNRGNVYLQAKDYPRAEEDFAKASTLRPDDPDPLERRARALDGQGKKEEARKAREDAAKLRARRPA